MYIYIYIYIYTYIYQREGFCLSRLIRCDVDEERLRNQLQILLDSVLDQPVFRVWAFRFHGLKICSKCPCPQNRLIEHRFGAESACFDGMGASV